MALTLHTGLLNRKVVFQKPTIGTNDEGGRATTYTNEITTFAHVREVSQSRMTEPPGTNITDQKDFYIRYAEARKAIGKDWRISYNDVSWTIHEVELLNEEKYWLRIRAKASGAAIVATGGDGGGDDGGGGTILTNYTDFTFDALNGIITMTGGTGSAPNTELSFYNNEGDVAIYTSAESLGVGSVLIPGGVGEGLTHFTPGNVYVRWRKKGAAPGYANLTALSSRNMTVERLARRWMPISRTQGSQTYNLPPTFNTEGATVELFNANGESSGRVGSIAEIVSVWNADPANEGFTIIDNRTLNGYIEVQIEPDAGLLIYPTPIRTHLTYGL